LPITTAFTEAGTRLKFESNRYMTWPIEIVRRETEQVDELNASKVQDAEVEVEAEKAEVKAIRVEQEGQ
jgi:hypothetical protein